MAYEIARDRLSAGDGDAVRAGSVIAFLAVLAGRDPSTAMRVAMVSVSLTSRPGMHRLITLSLVSAVDVRVIAEGC